VQNVAGKGAAGALAALGAFALAAGCGPADRERATPARRAVRAAEALLPDPGFYPPADGLVTDEQMGRYLRVRRAAKGRTDAETALALGIRPEEIAWTRARIVEALVALDERRVREASAEVYAKSIATLRASRAAVRDPGRARALEEQIATLERERATFRRDETPAPALARNMRRIAARRTELEAVTP
jgi:hypothetical protein